MTKPQDVRFAEAVAELRKRLDERGVTDAAAMAHDFMRDLIHEGWRPNARRIESSPASGHTADPQTAAREAEAMREQIRAAQAAMKAKEALQ